MISADMDKCYPSAKTLVKDCVASRIHARDASLYDFSEDARECAEDYMGWVDLAENPPYPLEEIQEFADRAVADGIDTVVLIGQGGSTQAPMTITKYNKVDKNRVSFKTLDSDSPVRVREFLSSCQPESTLVIISSKSGETIEPRLLLSAVRESLARTLSDEELVNHLVAITDPGSDLDRQARAEGWRAVFNGEPAVGGRYSALSVFGLLPAALAGVHLDSFIEHAVEAEKRCSEDAIDNPAINLAAFLHDNYLAGRNKFSFLTPKRGRVLGLWIEQLVAESLGKNGQGILPNIEIDSLLLAQDAGDRSVIMYQTKTDLWDETRNFEMSLAYVNASIPRQIYRLDSVEELAEHFVMWEYAIAMCGYLMKVCPFDQPDVASAKTEVLDILSDGQPEPDYVEMFTDEIQMGMVEVRQAPMFADCKGIRSTLRALLSSIQPGDFFALNAFLPFTGEGRREALEVVRHGVAEAFDVVSCLEVGPRYLHSTGQLQKGGPRCGVFLILSADELKDIPLSQEAESLGALAKAQAVGDLITLSERGRRCVHLHLPDNSASALRMLAQVVHEVIAEITTERLANGLTDASATKANEGASGTAAADADAGTGAAPAAVADAAPAADAGASPAATSGAAPAPAAATGTTPAAAAAADAGAAPAAGAGAAPAAAAGTGAAATADTGAAATADAGSAATAGADATFDAEADAAPGAVVDTAAANKGADAGSASADAEAMLSEDGGISVDAVDAWFPAGASAVLADEADASAGEDSAASRSEDVLDAEEQALLDMRDEDAQDGLVRGV